MQVLKFGGTSVGSADRIQEVIDILEKIDGRNIVVLSAMSGTTNSLVQIIDALNAGDQAKAAEIWGALEERYTRVLTDLYPLKEIRDKGRALIAPSFDLLTSKINKETFTKIDELEILAQGEIISTRLFVLQCEVRNVPVALIDALDFMRTDHRADPDLDESRVLLQRQLDTIDEEIEMVITQGYICRNVNGEVDNLKRGGSDYSATIIGSLVDADEIQIWTDIDGFHNNDPRIIEDTHPIRNLSYREAAELAYFGAKILHPTCVLPAEKSQIPLRLKCTMDPQALGTLITNKTSNRPVTALAAKGGISVIKVYSHRMLNAYGFLTQLFSVFEKHHTSVDMITTSEVAVSLTIDDDSFLENIISDLEVFAEVEVEHDYAIVCIVGNELYNDPKYAFQIFEALKEIPIRMTSMGGSRQNISLLVKDEFRKQALIQLNSLFATEVLATANAIA